MPHFSQSSLKKLATCDTRLIELFSRVVKTVDCSVIHGYRDRTTQNELFERGFSKLKYPNSKHNSNPAKAIDVMPFPVDWQNRERIILFAGFVLGVAKEMGVAIRWGGDWNTDFNPRNESFFDGAHFELMD